MPQLSYTNGPIPTDETPETVIRVWEVGVSSGEYDFYLIRGWGDMLEFVSNHMEKMLEDCDLDTDLLKQGATVTVKLREMTKEEYNEAQPD